MTPPEDKPKPFFQPEDFGYIDGNRDHDDTSCKEAAARANKKIEPLLEALRIAIENDWLSDDFKRYVKKLLGEE